MNRVVYQREFSSARHQKKLGSTMAEATNAGSWIEKGKEVRIIDWPGVALKLGDVGIAEDAPDESGTFWATFEGERRYNVRVHEVAPVT